MHNHYTLKTRLARGAWKPGVMALCFAGMIGFGGAEAPTLGAQIMAACLAAASGWGFYRLGR